MNNIKQLLIDEPFLVLTNLINSLCGCNGIEILGMAFSDEENEKLCRYFDNPHYKDVTPEELEEEMEKKIQVKKE